MSEYAVGLVVGTGEDGIYVASGGSYANCLAFIVDLLLKDEGPPARYDDIAPATDIGLGLTINGKAYLAIQSWQIDNGDDLVLVGIFSKDWTAEDTVHWTPVEEI